MGQEYVLSLAGDLGQEYDLRIQNDEQNLEDIYSLTDKIIPFLLENGDDISVVDLLLDIE